MTIGYACEAGGECKLQYRCDHRRLIPLSRPFDTSQRSVVRSRDNTPTRGLRMWIHHRQRRATRRDDGGSVSSDTRARVGVVVPSRMLRERKCGRRSEEYEGDSAAGTTWRLETKRIRTPKSPWVGVSVMRSNDLRPLESSKDFQTRRAGASTGVLKRGGFDDDVL